MRYIKTFENFDDNFVFLQQSKFWKNIFQKGDKLHIHIYELANEMESYANKQKETKKFARGGYSIPDDKSIVREMENEYINLVKKLLKGKVISFDDADFGSHFGICDSVSFDSNSAPGSPDTPDDNTFNTNFVQIMMMNSDRDWLNVDDEVIVHLDIDPEEYKNTDKFNI